MRKWRQMSSLANRESWRGKNIKERGSTRTNVERHYLQVGDDGKGEVSGGAGTTHVRGLDSAVQDGLGDGVGNLVGVIIETKVTEHHDGGKDHGGGVGRVASLNVLSDVTAALIE